MFPCAAIDAKTVISCLEELFAVFGMPSCIHSDWGSAFVSLKLITFLHLFGVPCNKTSMYNARGNGE